MKNKIYRKGFIFSALLGFVAILIIVSVFYIYKNKKVEAPLVVNEVEEVIVEEKEVNDKTDISVKNSGILGNKEDLVSFSVKAGDIISGLLKLSGVVKNGYFFEGNIGIALLDSNKNLLKQGNGIATSDWMTRGPVSFTSTIDSTLLSGKGYIAIQEDDPSNGEGGIPGEILVPVIFGNVKQETLTVKVYFGDTIDAQSCNTPSYIERIIPKTTAVAKVSILELLKGPTEEEKMKDFWTGLRFGILINSISITNGVAYLDLSTPMSSSLNDPNKGACGAIIALKQIEKTLKQFSTIKSVITKVNGQPAENFIDP